MTVPWNGHFICFVINVFQVHSIIDVTRVHMYKYTCVCVLFKKYIVLFCELFTIHLNNIKKKKFLEKGRSNVFWSLLFKFNCEEKKIVPPALRVPNIIYSIVYAKARRLNTITIDACTQIIPHIYTKTSKRTKKPYEPRRRK